jgi:polyphosphate glucokinase
LSNTPAEPTPSPEVVAPPAAPGAAHEPILTSEVAAPAPAAAPPAANEEASPDKAPAPKKPAPANILVVDIGGTKVKILASGQTEPRKAPSGKGFTPAKLVETVRELARGWEYEAISIGYPGMVGDHGPRSEPGNLAPGWVGFDFAAAFGLPVKMVNDAAMQALGSYEGGRMLFLGLGTGLGSAMIAGNVILPLELGRLPFDGDRTMGEALGRKGMEKAGKGAWREAVTKAITSLMGAFVADYLVVGGGNAKHFKELPPGARRGHNLTAFRGGIRLWGMEDVWALVAYGGEHAQPTAKEALRML